MKGKTNVLILMMIGLFLLTVMPAIAQEEKPNEEMQKQMEMWAKLAEPGIHHQHLKQLEGTWDATVKMWTAPDAPPTESKGSAVIASLMGGRYIEGKFKGEAMGQPFEGVALYAYDNGKQEYISTWYDSMSTGIMIGRGKCEDNGKKWIMMSESFNPMTKKMERSKGITRIVNKDSFVDEMYQIGPDGKEFKMMEITYTRKK